MIQPTYVTFEQAKLLKEKGFEGIQIDYGLNQMLNYSKPPEQWQVVEWLRITYNIDLQSVCNYGRLGRTYRMGIIFINKQKEVDTIFLRPIDSPFEFIEFKSPQEAYSAAFDYILKELI